MALVAPHVCAGAAKAGLHFVCKHVLLRVESEDSRFTNATAAGQILNIPIAHGEGCYFADDATLERLRTNKQVLLPVPAS